MTTESRYEIILYWSKDEQTFIAEVSRVTWLHG